MYENDAKTIKKAQEGDKFELERLIRQNNGLIWSIVKRFYGRGYEAEDLYQIGCMGFIKSIKRFDTTFEVKLSTYCVPYILGEIKRFIRDDGPIKISRSTKDLAIKIKELQKEYNKKGKDISIEQIAKELKLSKEDIIFAMESSNTVESFEVNIMKDSSSDDKKISLIDRIATDKNEEEVITNKIVLQDIIAKLENREKEVILLRFFKEKTQTEVAKILGITQVQVSRIERKTLARMKQKLIS